MVASYSVYEIVCCGMQCNFGTMKPDCAASEFQGSRESRPGPGGAYGAIRMLGATPLGGEREIFTPTCGGLYGEGGTALV